MASLPFENKTTLITNSGRGIGKRINMKKAHQTLAILVVAGLLLQGCATPALPTTTALEIAPTSPHPAPTA